MYLNMWNIYDWFQSHGIDATAQIEDDIPSLKGVRMYSDSETSAPEFLVVSPVTHVAGLNEYDTVNLINGKSLVAVTGIKPVAVLNRCIECFEFYADWEMKLSNRLFSRNALQEMIDLSAQALPYPLLIGNINAKVLAYSDRGTNTLMLFEDIKKTGYLPSQSSYDMVSRVDAVSMFTTRHANFYKYLYNQDSEYVFIRSNIWSGQTWIGMIQAFDYGNGITRGSLNIMDIFCSYIEKHIFIQGEIYKEESLLADLLILSLETGELKKEKINGLINNLKWPQTSGYVTVRIEMKSKSFSSPFMKTKCMDIQHTLKDCCAFIYNAGINLFMSNSNNRIKAEAIKILLEIFDEKDFSIGVSNSFRDISLYILFYGQSCRTLEYGTLPESTYPVFASDVVAEDISHYAKNHADLSIMISPDIFKLLEYDASNNTEYAKTLFQYLFAAKNLTDAAQKLGIHRNTMIYRVSRLREMLSQDFDNDQGRISLLISYFLYGIPLI